MHGGFTSSVGTQCAPAKVKEDWACLTFKSSIKPCCRNGFGSLPQIAPQYGNMRSWEGCKGGVSRSYNYQSRAHAPLPSGKLYAA
ncbi:hypothetical protein QJS10_CPB13g00798 [Acorus calamus]|uniref:Uncharacterized protein n=1 Tax=Acorus calamus TaxID=4465 RepID=A0AAV9DI99_ACOCL|nr:hypothetical protein QJS10_CPB13g00798 [Acorus calamus]